MFDLNKNSVFILKVKKKSEIIGVQTYSLTVVKPGS
jgi:hypothetical protein